MHRILSLSPWGMAAWAVVWAWAPCALAVNGTWTNTGGGDYNTASNWAGNTVGSGAGSSADFSTLNISSDVVVMVDQALTIGSLLFGDTNTGSGGTWEFRTGNSSVITLDNGGAAPTITVNPLIPVSTFDDAFIGNSVAGTAGLTKQGAGILTLGGSANTLTGGINVNAGSLRLNTAIPAQVISLASGTTLQTAVEIASANAVAAGGTATVRTTFAGTTRVGGFNTTPGSGGAMDVQINGTGRIDITRDWTGFGTFNLTGLDDGTQRAARLNVNDGGNSANGGLWTSAVLNMSNVAVHTRTNSFGNTIPIGELHGTANSTLRGGEAGSAARYEIGSLNTDSAFAGVIDGTGGLTINKVGTGRLTLAGTFNASPALAGNTLPRQGGVFRVTAGTLAVTGATSIPGGTGTTLTTIDVLADGRFDVSGAPGTFATADLQKLQGSGTVVGAYNHAAGLIQPGDVGAATAANEGNLSSGVVPTAGTLMFEGSLQMGGGTIVYDMSTNAAAGNDLIHVTGTTALNSGKITPNFFSGIPSSGTYTVIQSDGGFTGSASNITVDFPGRGADPVAVVNGNMLQFTPTAGGGSANLVWRGNNASSPTLWNVETTQNWLNGANNDVFFNLDAVTFDDTATGTTVDVATSVSPSSITMNNPTKAYTFSGAGSITGTTGLTKTGAGALSMQVANNFTGPVSIQGGSLDIGAFARALGTGPATFNGVMIAAASGGMDNSSITNGGTTTFTLAGNAGSGGTFNVPTLAGDGTLTFTTGVADKWVALNGTGDFTGTLNIGSDGVTGTTMTARLTTAGGGTTFPNAVVNLTNGVTMANRQGAAAGVVATFEFGELHGDGASILNAFIGGSAAVPANWQVGALDTNSMFEGTIVNGAGSGGSTSVSHVTKVGTGTLVLTNANTYTGTTSVVEGTLSIAVPYLDDASLVRLTTGGKLELGFSGADTIGALLLDGAPAQTGTWGAPGSGAQFTTSLLSGTGLLQVTAVALPGDFDSSGTVDAADLAQWQANYGNSALGDADGDFDADGGDFLVWQRNLGRTAAAAAIAAVPEPTGAALVASGMLVGAVVRRRQRGAV